MNALQKPIVMFSIGVLSMLAVIMLTGAASTSQVGKYQVHAVTKNHNTNVYVIDTTTGAVKWVDSFNTPFEEMKGD